MGPLYRQLARQPRYHRHLPDAHRSGNCGGLAAAAATPTGRASIGLVLNGVTTVIFGSVRKYAAPERRTHVLSVFYTISIGAAAVSPPVARFLSDLIGISRTIMVLSTLTRPRFRSHFFSRTRAARSPSKVAVPIPHTVELLSC
jgi:MFS family permease